MTGRPSAPDVVGAGLRGISLFNLNDFDEAPPPPPYLYKYLPEERIENVLEGGVVRFTPLFNTNDLFEVRLTFEKLAGPKFCQLLSDQMDLTVSRESVRELTAKILAENGLGALPVDVVLDLADQHFGGDFAGTVREMMQVAAETMLVPHFNDPMNILRLLERMGRELLCFSLSDRMDIAPMWAHYANNNRGFVVAFRSEHEWFRRRKNGEDTRLQKVTYFDGKLDEPFENVQAAFISKTTDWAYECEWRLYAKEGQVDRIVGESSDPIHLIDFPPDAVDRVILGSKSSDQTSRRIREILASKYPLARLVRAVPDPNHPTYQEVPFE